MTFKEWLQQKRDYLTAFYGRVNEAYFTPNEIDLAEEAWDTAMEEAAKVCEAAGERALVAERTKAYRTAAMMIRLEAHPTSSATPALPQEAPEAETPASTAPSPGPRREPG